MTSQAKSSQGSQIWIGLYRPHAGKEAALRDLVRQHVPLLLRLELITDRPAVLMRAEDGTYIEIAEWRTGESAAIAHQHPELAKVWEAMGEIADFPALESLPEAKKRFPNFDPVVL
jgi:hypothetical protein